MTATQDRERVCDSYFLYFANSRIWNLLDNAFDHPREGERNPLMKPNAEN